MVRKAWKAYTEESLGGAIGTGILGSMMMFGGAGHYGFVCACDPTALYECDKEGDALWHHASRCGLQHNAA